MKIHNHLIYEYIVLNLIFLVIASEIRFSSMKFQITRGQYFEAECTYVVKGQLSFP